jgi:thermitase
MRSLGRVAAALVVALVLALGAAAAGPLIPNDPFWDRAAMTQIDTPRAWGVTTGSSSVIVAVVDSGVNPVPDLAGALVTGYDVLDDSSNVSDDFDHGTHMAGIVAARPRTS